MAVYQVHPVATPKIAKPEPGETVFAVGLFEKRAGGGSEPFPEDALVPRRIEASVVVDDEAPKLVLPRAAWDRPVSVLAGGVGTLVEVIA